MIRKPQFGEWYESELCSKDNPHRQGMFVRAGYRGKNQMNAGHYWEFTDGKGDFWTVSQEGSQYKLINKYWEGDFREELCDMLLGFEPTEESPNPENLLWNARYEFSRGWDSAIHHVISALSDEREDQVDPRDNTWKSDPTGGPA